MLQSEAQKRKTVGVDKHYKMLPYKEDSLTEPSAEKIQESSDRRRAQVQELDSKKKEADIGEISN